MGTELGITQSSGGMLVTVAAAALVTACVNVSMASIHAMIYPHFPSVASQTTVTYLLVLYFLL